MTASGGATTSAAGDAWELTAQLSPRATTAASSDGNSEDELDLAPPAWTTGSEGLRSTVKWLIAAFAAIGGVLFAKGLVTVPQLSWKDNTLQLLVAAACGIASLLAIGWLLALAVDLIRPTVYALTRLPPGYENEIDNDVQGHLPSDCRTFAEYKKNLDAVLTDTAALRANRDRKQAQLNLLKAATNPDPEQLRRAELDLSVAQLDYQSSKTRLAVYAKTRETLLARAEYWSESTLFSRKRTGIIVAAVVAAVGGIFYQLVLATPAKSDKTAGESSASAPVSIGQLVRLDNAASKELWSTLHLGGCQGDPATPRIPVVISSGKGVAADPYVVTTIPTATCMEQTFSVLDDVAQVSRPKPLTIVYTPSSSASSAPSP